MGNVLEVKEMNRQQRRANKKAMKWFASLSKDKKKFFDNYANKKANEIIYENDKLGMDILLTNIDSSISATLIYLYNSNLEEIEKFADTFKKVLDENIDFVIREGKDWKMKLEKIEPQVIEKAVEVIKEDKDKHNYHVKMKELFPNLTRGQLFNAYKLAEERLEDSKNDVDEALDYIFAEKQKEVVKEVTENVEKEIKDMESLNVIDVLKTKKESLKTEREHLSKEIDVLQKRLRKVVKDEENIVAAIEKLKEVEF